MFVFEEMGCREKSLFDLNELPEDGDAEREVGSSFQPQKVSPSLNSQTTIEMFAPSPESSQTLSNNHAFSHASSASGFQPFVKLKDVHNSEENVRRQDSAPSRKIVDYNEENKVADIYNEAIEREEGEWPDVDNTKAEAGIVKDESSSQYLGLDSEKMDRSSISGRSSDGNMKGDIQVDVQEESSSVLKQRDVKGIERNHAFKSSNILGKKHKLDEHKDAMLGKKQGRQTKLIRLEDVNFAGPIKTSTPRRLPISSTLTTRTIKKVHNSTAPAEHGGERQGEPTTKDHKQANLSSKGWNTSLDYNDRKSESNGDMNHGIQAKSWKAESASEAYPPITRQGSWKQATDLRQLKQTTAVAWKSTSGDHNSTDTKLGTKKHPPGKKQIANNTQYQDTSVERLLREVTNDKFWHHPEDTELQCVPGYFESVEEYVRVFEPLLFEECRAQLYSTWEESTETVSRDAHIMVRVKSVERRERGWYDITVLPVHERKWTFKEGEVAVLSQLRPGSGGRSKRNNNGVSEDYAESEAIGRVAGTVRRHTPIDTRDPPGAILHYYVGDSFDPNSQIHSNHVIRKFQPQSIWYLTVLGSLTTSQREYIALHAFRRLNLQMQTAILKPSVKHFPKYEEHPPAMPECFTQNFVDHLYRTFNGPQLGAIQWAAMHTAAGTSSGMTKKQDPWPFTLVQGPPGTGKTHTVWGMLNVIHLVQYQHYYTALLKTLAPESYKQITESSSGSVSNGSIDEVLQSMDQNLFRTLPKLCPKPRMLVCAPSNAATDELLSRVLGRGFIDGEMKVYRPDVARVGVDTQTRAAQAVSVERRTEQLLAKGREEIRSWMHQLKTREVQLSQQIAYLQRELNVAAAAGRSQGSVGVDPDVLVARDHNRDTLLQNLAAVVEGRDKVLVEMSRLLIVEGKFRVGSSFNLEEARANLEASFANEAEIVFTTVSSSGRKLFSRMTQGFDMIVIDEAAQASEVAVLPPLSLGAARCVLVGDPQQLPATVISKAAGTLLYSRSLFERFQQAGCPTILLSVQYRMHPQIRDFPSRYFYQGRLTDSESVIKLPDEIYYKDPLLKPYAFYDITYGRESHRDGSVSFQNVHEAQFCLRIYEHLQKTLKSLGANKVSIGIITPYKLQLKCLKREFEEVLNSEEGKELYINTVDAFQGQERDVIIMSCVRASNHGVGFVADIRRMNVALTRARRALWVMGNANALMKSEDWAAMIVDAKARNCYVDMESLPKDFLNVKGHSHTPLTVKELKPLLPSLSMRVNNLEKPPSMGLKPSDRVKSFNDLGIANRLNVRSESICTSAYTLEDLQAATSNFATGCLRGEGSAGWVYRAKFADGKVLAVKKMNSSLFQNRDAESFTAMITNISMLHHPNIAELVGYCSEKGHNLLVYDFFRNGSLNEFLHLTNDYRKPLTWSTRVRIALSTARAVEYLHEVCSPSVVHKNIKSSNILLDTELNPHLSDCGLTNFHQFTSENVGVGYIAPECIDPLAYTPKSDVYSFGVVLLELLSGQMPFDSMKPNTEQSLVCWARPQLHDIGLLAKMVDPALGGLYPPDSLAIFADVIALCVQNEPELRPPISAVVRALMRLLQRLSMNKRGNDDSSTSSRRTSDSDQSDNH